MNKYLLPSILGLTVVAAGFVAMSPVDNAVTLHGGGTSTTGEGSIDTAELADDAVTKDKIDANTGTLTGSWVSSEIANDTITTDDIANGTIAAIDIGTDAVDADEIATDAVNSSEIQDGGVNASEFAADAIATDQGSNTDGADIVISPADNRDGAAQTIIVHAIIDLGDADSVLSNPTLSLAVDGADSGTIVPATTYTYHQTKAEQLTFTATWIVTGANNGGGASAGIDLTVSSGSFSGPVHSMGAVAYALPQ